MRVVLTIDESRTDHSATSSAACVAEWSVRLSSKDVLWVNQSEEISPSTQRYLVTSSFMYRMIVCPIRDFLTIVLHIRAVTTVVPSFECLTQRL